MKGNLDLHLPEALPVDAPCATTVKQAQLTQGSGGVSENYASSRWIDMMESLNIERSGFRYRDGTLKDFWQEK